jgi:Ser/Thr protein kinase RdoA (MazF antagonist)
MRVTHNDTKLNNVLFDRETRKALCVIDLDTVMPGLAANDFGDSIRFGASTAAEDERDLSKVSLSLPMLEAYTAGFLSSCGESLTQAEILHLRDGIKMMTLECGLRFLTDYLEGDVYFRTHREGHNLDRCRNQFKLISDIEKYWGKIQEIILNGDERSGSCAY